MAFRVQAQTPEEFQAWSAHMQTLGPSRRRRRRRPSPVRTAGAGPSGARSAPRVPPIRVRRARSSYGQGCVACHSLNAYEAPKGMIGPNLANVGARSYIAAGTLKNTDENLAHWIRDPQASRRAC